MRFSKERVFFHVRCLNPCPRGHEFNSLVKGLHGYHTYAYHFSQMYNGVEKKIFYDLIHFSYMEYNLHITINAYPCLDISKVRKNGAVFLFIMFLQLAKWFRITLTNLTNDIVCRSYL